MAVEQRIFRVSELPVFPFVASPPPRPVRSSGGAGVLLGMASVEDLQQQSKRVYEEQIVRRAPGRPSSYTQEMADEVCLRIANGETMSKICKDAHMPFPAVIYAWAARNEEFHSRLTRAREIQAHRWADEILEIVDDNTGDMIEKVGRNGQVTTVVDHENVHRSRLRADTRKWLIAKMYPRVYGDKVQAEVTGSSGGPVSTVSLSVTIPHDLSGYSTDELAKLYREAVEPEK